MDSDQREKLLGLIDQLGTSEDAKAAFMERPIATIKETLNIPTHEGADDLSDANRLLLSVISNPACVDDLTRIAAACQYGDITPSDARSQVIDVVSDSAPPDLQDTIEEWRRRQLSPEVREMIRKWEKDGVLPGYDPPKWDPHGPDPVPDSLFLANPVVAVDSLAVITSLAVIHAEYVVSGRTRSYPIGDMRSFANAVTKS